jgi:hypothetical protein
MMNDKWGRHAGEERGRACPTGPQRHLWRGRVVRTSLAAAAALTVLGACSVSTTKKLDTAEGEELIRAYLGGRVEGPLGEVRCDETAAKRGAMSGCTAVVDGQQLRLTITQDDEKGNVTILPVQAILDVKQAVALVEQEASKAKKSTMKADCGTQRYLVKDPGATFDCQVATTSGRSQGRVVVTVKDVEGSVDLHLA